MDFITAREVSNLSMLRKAVHFSIVLNQLYFITVREVVQVIIALEVVNLITTRTSCALYFQLEVVYFIFVQEML